MAAKIHMLVQMRREMVWNARKTVWQRSYFWDP